MAVIGGPDRPRGTPGIATREPLAVAIATGRKKDQGFGVVDRHRFFIVNAKADGKGKDARRALHPMFARFNALTPARLSDGSPGDQSKHDAERATIRGIIVHATEEEAFWTNYQAQTLPGHQHPTMAPSCQGNGDRARRWMLERRGPDGATIPAGYADIPCPGELCEFSQPGMKNGKPTRSPCGPYACLVFQLRFENMPCLSAKYESRGKESNGAIKGFFVDLKRQASMLGVENPNLYGIPFVLEWTPRSNGEAQTKWHVASLSTDFPPGMTLQQFFLLQIEERGRLVSKAPLLLGSAPTVIDVMSETEDYGGGNLGEGPPPGVGVSVNQWGRP